MRITGKGLQYWIMVGALACGSVAGAESSSLPLTAALEEPAELPLTAALTTEEIPSLPLTEALSLRAMPQMVLAQAGTLASTPVAAPAGAGGTVALATLTEARKGERVRVSGKVSGYRASNNPRAPHSFQLRDGAGTTLRVAVWDDVFSKIPEGTRAAIVQGDADVTMTAKVAVFRGQVELHLGAASDVQVAGAPAVAAPAPAVASATGALAPGQITIGDKGKNVTVRAKVESARRPASERAPFVLRLVGEPGAIAGGIDLVFWEDTQKAIPAEHQAEPGDLVEVKGTVGEYRGTLQLRLNDPTGLKVLKKGTAEGRGGGTSKAPSEPTPIALQDLGKHLNTPERVRVQGRVVAVEPVTYGNKVTLADLTSDGVRAMALYYDSALKPGQKPEVGASLTLDGTVMALSSGDPVLVVNTP